MMMPVVVAVALQPKWQFDQFNSQEFSSYQVVHIDAAIFLYNHTMEELSQLRNIAEQLVVVCCRRWDQLIARNSRRGKELRERTEQHRWCSCSQWSWASFILGRKAKIRYTVLIIALENELEHEYNIRRKPKIILWLSWMKISINHRAIEIQCLEVFVHLLRQYCEHWNSNENFNSLLFASKNISLVMFVSWVLLLDLVFDDELSDTAHTNTNTKLSVYYIHT